LTTFIVGATFLVLEIFILFRIKAVDEENSLLTTYLLLVYFMLCLAASILQIGGGEDYRLQNQIFICETLYIAALSYQIGIFMFRH